MIRGLRNHSGGFTILETIIVLTVSSALIASAMLIFRNRIPSVQFSKSVNELSDYFRNVHSDVSTGYYPSGGDKCKVNSSFEPYIDTTEGALAGESEGCVYLGQAINFGPNNCSGNCTAIKSFTVFGSRLKAANQIATSLVEAKAKIDSDYGISEYETGYGLSVEKIKVGTNTYAGLAYLMSFGSATGVGGEPVGTPQVSVVAIRDNPGSVSTGTVDNIFVSNVANSGADSLSNADVDRGGILLCLKSNANQYATILLGEGGNSASVTSEILDKDTWNTKC